MQPTLSLPAKVYRCEELLFLWAFAHGVLLLRWAAQLEPAEVRRWEIDIGGPLLSKRQRAMALDNLTAQTALRPSRPETQMLAAATRWFCAFDLPENEGELWGGAPLFARRRDRPVAVTLAAPERDAIYVLTLDALSGIASGLGPEIDADELRQVLTDLQATGNGPVELEIENVPDARRVFRQLADLAELSIPSLESETARKACRRIVATIDAASELALIRV